MSEVSARLAQLSAEERALLFEKLRRRKEQEGRAAPPTDLQPIPRRPDPGPAPLSFAQQRLWFLHQLSPGDPSYHIPLTAVINGPLDPGGLRRALRTIAGRHEALCTTFGVLASEPVQRVAPRWEEVPLPVVDLAGIGPDSEPEVLRLGADLFAVPFDLAAGPLLRAALLRLGPRRHVLALTIHHIVSDGWSMDVLIGDLAELSAGAELPPLPVQPADHAVWQRSWLRGERLQELMALWRRRLGGLPEALELPADRPRPPVKSAAGALFRLHLDAATDARVQAAAREEGVTPFMFLLAAYQVLLSRWSGQELFAVGSVVAGRTRPELARLIGFFANTLALRADVSGDPAGRDLLARVRGVTLEAFAHQEVPFEKLVEELRPARDPSRSPVFQVSLSLKNTPRATAAFGGLALTPLEIPVRHVKFDLEAAFDHGGHDELQGALTYSTALFDAATVERMAAHFRVLLAALAEDRERRIADLPLLTPGEVLQLEAWNRTRVRGPETPPEARFAALAAADPGAPALVSAAGMVTRGELAAAADRLARRLRRLGVGPEVPVGVALPRSPDLVLAALAVARSGGAYLPLDPAYPAERIVAILADAAAPVVLTRGDLAGRLAGGGVLVVDPTDRTDPTDRREDPAPADPGHLAYLIYTSGSTGRPKGVGVPRGALANLVAWSLRAWPPAPGERATLMAGPSFDGSVWELWAFLCAGAALHVPEEEVRLSPPRLAAWLRSEGITRTFLPTPLAEALLAEPEIAELPLRVLLTGGDRLHRISRADLPFAVANCYGPSEAAVVTSWNPDAAREPGDRDPSVGGPIDNAEVWLLDPALRPVPVGVPGELWVGGEILARGYLGRPDLTAEAYRPDPFALVPGARLYRTGDLARRRPDGAVEVLGRVDGQVKVRGFRIEPGEVEAVLAGHPAVRQAVVLPWEARGDRGLAAYLVAGNVADEIADDELRAHLRRRLPEFMVPALFVRLPELPLTPGGKVDRAALGSLAGRIPPPARAVVPPRSATERTLAALWAEVLGRAEPGVDESFFDLGGHSLLLTRLQTRIAEALGREVPLLTLIEYPTIAAFAAWLETEGDSAAPAIPVETGASRDRAARQRQALEAQRRRLAPRRPA
jgi:amino acid adenylation domain-containing protein